MKINGNTKISQVIKENKEAIDVIASLNPNFSRLKNPIFYWFFSSHITIDKFAEKLKCETHLLLWKLREIGFETEDLVQPIPNAKELYFLNAKADFIKEKRVKSIDLNSILAGSEEDLIALLEREVTKLEINEVLSTRLDSNPIFLTKLFERMGFATLTFSGDGVYDVYFKRNHSRFKKKNKLFKAIGFSE
ncbi:DUF1858 domain-containing protein [Brumimicrobium oceani]|uniref:DUF1858 domain-containing protein n=1 Tax=Brumimicrobium oceani TaxID=2100725 RepID=A0A2U2XA71_9FLAO|nr:DUF1858 domain-containing protein [Brumimicrobium oceani]PWH84688.1 hypothetical protein DIT68_13270 [Brumimicrobium oceani]